MKVSEVKKILALESHIEIQEIKKKKEEKVEIPEEDTGFTLGDIVGDQLKDEQ